jgi:hypothetical protein
MNPTHDLTEMSPREREWWQAAGVLAIAAAISAIVAALARADRVAFIAGMHAGRKAAQFRERVQEEELQ